MENTLVSFLAKTEKTDTTHVCAVNMKLAQYLRSLAEGLSTHLTLSNMLCLSTKTQV